MNTLEVWVNIFSYAIFSMSGLLVWNSRRNIVTWLNFPFFIISVIVPLSIVQYEGEIKIEIIRQLTLINMMGAIGMVIGVEVGKRINFSHAHHFKTEKYQKKLDQKHENKLFIALLLACILMTFSFIWMGFLPIFAENPFLAKFFKGEYKEKYDQVSILYRISQLIIYMSLPMALAKIIFKKEWSYILIVLWSMFLLVGGLNRGTVLYGFLIVVGIMASESKRVFYLFLIVLTLLNALGSGIYVVIGILGFDEIDVLKSIANGAPDILDQLTFLQSFEGRGNITYGATFVGGLVPGNYYYNPSVFTLAITNNNSDISEIASGGFRLSPAISGYIAFSWLGAFFVPAITGVITAKVIKKLRRTENMSRYDRAIGASWQLSVGSFFVNWYNMTYQGLLSFIIFKHYLKIKINYRK